MESIVGKKVYQLFLYGIDKNNEASEIIPTCGLFFNEKMAEEEAKNRPLPDEQYLKDHGKAFEGTEHEIVRWGYFVIETEVF